MSTSTRGTARRIRARGKLPAKHLEAICRDLAAGGVAVFPTETVYGLGTSAFSREGIGRLYRMKGRSWRKALALLVPDLKAAAPLVEEMPQEAYRVAERWCPGPITLVLKASALGRWVAGGKTTIAVRVPDHPVALGLLRRVGVPLAATSVNRSGEAPAASGAACARGIGRFADWLVDAGPCRVKTPSTVVDFSHYPFTVVREGAVSKAQLEKALNLA